MRAAVIYESMFGSTRQVAQAVAAELAERMEVDVYEVGEAPLVLDEGVGLVVVGGPTHAFSLSRPSTRAEAALKAPDGLVSTQIGLREWLEAVEAPAGVQAIAFDTRVDRHFTGSAARSATRRLRRAGFRVLGEPVSFFVDGILGPVAAGEFGRARLWAAEVGAAAFAMAR
ncbi:MAG: flavodoxin family protein [Glycomyces artemisiae]|uniref:Flavodoxin family protein n=1 Tax=Glycomyces artemisiae TaxID=1076443 RepID=A0A850CFG0_9ACTN|nr:flavodoxin family protein [Glycomyces artemisiae]